MTAKRGLVHIYTGDGKGKTTTSLGVALRALGWGFKVVMLQFIKGYQDLGEIKFAEDYGGNFTVRQFAIDVARDIPPEKVLARKECAETAMQQAEEVVLSGEFDLVILDELCVAVQYGLIDVERVVKLMEEKPESVELIMTGRGAPKELIQVADYVTEMRQVKHPYENGVQARPGIDF